MVKNSDKPGSSTPNTPPFPDNIKDSAQQIWLAGLAAFSKAQEEGGKVFDALVQEGLVIQRKTQATAQEKLGEARRKVSGLAGELGERATSQWDKVEQIFEDRVARALPRLGIPTQQELAALAQRVDELSRAVAQLSASRTPPAKAARSAAVKRTTPAPVKKRAAPRKTR